MEKLHILIPLFIYPNPINQKWWTQIGMAANKVPITAIINPGDGPVDAKHPHYAEYIQTIPTLKPGVTIIGYVCTYDGDKKYETKIKDNVKLYYEDTNYHIDGIFYDEVSTDPVDVDYYRSLYEHVKNTSNNCNNPHNLVVLNPGTKIPEDYIKPPSPAGDVVVICEDYADLWDHYKIDEYVHSYSREQFAVIIQGDRVYTMNEHIDKAIADNIGYIYITDKKRSWWQLAIDTKKEDIVTRSLGKIIRYMITILHGNEVYGDPYCRLPSFWQAEIDYLGKKNSQP
jgi:hypothetical protein